MASYAIGDLQGCYRSFMALLEAIDFSSDDQLWLAGDLVNRGPGSLEVLRFALKHQQQLQVVLGNHDLHLLAVAFGDARCKPKDTLDSILEATDREHLLAWLLEQKLFHYDTQLGYCMSHAGLPPQWDIPTAAQLAQEVETVLTSDDAANYFRQMYGNSPDLWHPELEGMDRLRCITNYFTRMRFCTLEGQLEFASKEGLNSQPEGFIPWFSHPQRKAKDQRILFGHWAALEGLVKVDNVFALDTGCVWGGKLTAMRLEDGEFFSVPNTEEG